MSFVTLSQEFIRWVFSILILTIYLNVTDVMKLLKDISWNMASYIIPMLVAIPTLGIIARHLEVERFGLFMLIYTILGYASIFDLGFTRALVRCISRVKHDIKEVKEYLLSTLIVVFFLSLIPMLLLFVFSGKIAGLLKVTTTNVDEFTTCLNISAICFPMLMIFLVLSTYFEGNERFKHLSLIKVITSVCLSIFPMLFVMYGSTLIFAVVGIAIARIVALFLISITIFSEIGNVKSKILCLNKIKNLIQYGSWLTLTNVINPLLTSIDRFILSSASGANSVALYTAPSEIINKCLVFPNLVARTLFPKFARGNDYLLQRTVSSIVFVGMCVACTILYFFSEIIINLWLGSKYVDSVMPFKILVVGLFFCGIAQLPYIVMQAKGFSKVAAIIHSIEVVPYLALLYYLSSHYQYIGAAIAWTIRVSIDSILFLSIEKFHIRKLEVING